MSKINELETKQKNNIPLSDKEFQELKNLIVRFETLSNRLQKIYKKETGERYKYFK